MSFATDGYLKFAPDPRVLAWARAAKTALQGIEFKPRRHGNTWFVGVDVLPNAPDGSVGEFPLSGPWDAYVSKPANWHRAQVSVVYPGYPGQDADETAAAHRFRRERDAAHVDGLLPVGSARRRYLREPHAFILGLPLSDVSESPLVAWKGSHVMIRAAFEAAFAGRSSDTFDQVDVTEVYQEARREVFETCARVTLPAGLGEATLLHRHTVHGVAPWGDGAGPRPIAYFRPMTTYMSWLTAP